jgi:hypothetical protein
VSENLKIRLVKRGRELIGWAADGSTNTRDFLPEKIKGFLLAANGNGKKCKRVKTLD